MEIHYLNTDLIIESKSDLSRIVEELGDDVIVLHHGERRGYQHASFETAVDSTDADGTINSFCMLIESLPHDAREIWNECLLRVFDVGYESGSSPPNYRSEIRASTIRRVANIGASIVTTIYPEPPDRLR